MAIHSSSGREMILCLVEAKTAASFGQILSGLGLGLEMCNDQESARRLVDKASPPRIAIVDVSVPQLAGLEFVENLRVQAVQPTPVIMLCTDEELAEVEAIQNWQLDDFCLLPFDTENLLKKVREALGRAQEQRTKSTAHKKKSLGATRSRQSQARNKIPLPVFVR
jgi:DNA-binding response OmpR family regulator